jgi:hypothetical protein
VTGFARLADPFMLGVDSYQKPTAAQAKALFADGFKYYGRYIDAGFDVAERDMLFGIGFKILPLTVAPTGIALNAAVGLSRGGAEVRRLMALGAPSGISCILDLESTTGPSNDITAYVNAWNSVLKGAGYQAALYVGMPQPLTAAQLYALDVTRYMKSISAVPEVACGWCCIQLEPGDVSMHGMRVDVSVTCQDYRGRSLTLWSPT